MGVDPLTRLGAAAHPELAYHRRALAERWGEFFVSTRATIGRATYFTGADYVQAQRLRRTAADAVTALLRDVDVIATPTASIVAGAHFDEAAVLRAGTTYQQRTDWHRQAPPGMTSQRRRTLGSDSACGL